MKEKGKAGPPHKHHYVPVFFLRRWATEEDAKVWSFRFKNARLEVKRDPPGATGFGFDLYALSAGTPDEQQVIESEFMQQVDSRAAQALCAVLAEKGKPASTSVASDWCAFVMSLLNRSPMRLEKLSALIDPRDHGADDALRARYEAMRGPEWPSTLEEHLAEQGDDRFAKDLAKLLMIRLTSSPELEAKLLNMKWGVRSFGASFPTLLMSDTPVVIDQFGSPGGFLVLPIGPRHAFFAAEGRATFKKLRHMNSGAFIKTANLRTVQRAQDLVISADRTHDDHIKRQFQPHAQGSPVQARSGTSS